ncbi:hypothetical protein RvY_16400-2 [Ramazzottius varieornatus]|uniref:Calcineurin-like phosphoesterase domain-containing protein n=1 Tax=Ramazzottius varieornatus TaxID=947166 RepID=A0A1D1VZL3_RAMVA|nr:hypothetical protein RvY_16400-2 [Ramazzottius varieornatus]
MATGSGLSRPARTRRPSGIELSSKYAQPPDVRLRSPLHAFKNDTAWRGPFYFIQGADPQFGMFDGWLRKKTDFTEITWEEDMALMRLAVDDINRLSISPIPPAFFVICGDLVHEFGINELKKAQEKDFLITLNEVNPKIPIVLVPGNHDIQNTPGQADLDHFKETFGPDYYTFDARGVRCICINSQFLKTVDEAPASFLTLQLVFFKWFEAEIARAKADLQSKAIQHAIIFQHISWFIQSPDEKTEYFNADIEIRQQYLPKLIDAGPLVIWSTSRSLSQVAHANQPIALATCAT